MANDFGIEEPQSDKAHIVELVNMNLQQATNFGELAKRFDALKVELEEAKAHEIEARDAKSAQDDENWKFIENLKSERDAALAQVVVLREAIEELIEVADLRGDSDLPHPADDPKLWTARMIDAWDGGREALSSTSATAQQTVERIEREALEKAVDSVNQLHPPMGRAAAPLRAAILGEKEANDGHQDRTP